MLASIATVVKALERIVGFKEVAAVVDKLKHATCAKLGPAPTDLEEGDAPFYTWSDPFPKNVDAWEVRPSYACGCVWGTRERWSSVVW